jgi:transcriptional regulator GlxA family with amidase domain
MNQLSGLSATAHPDFIVQLKSLCSEAASQYQTQPANVIEKAGYVVCHNTKSPDRLRIITTDGPSSGIDAALYIVSTFVHSESAAEVAKSMLWTKGNGIIDDGLGT